MERKQEIVVAVGPIEEDLNFMDLLPEIPAFPGEEY